MTLTEFLTARLDEDEADAQAALERGFGGWEWLADAGINYEARTHIVRHHPARVLAEVAAKRAIVDLADFADEDGAWPVYLAAVRCLAAVYSDHDDYDPAWRP